MQFPHIGIHMPDFGEFASLYLVIFQRQFPDGSDNGPGENPGERQQQKQEHGCYRNGQFDLVQEGRHQGITRGEYAYVQRVLALTGAGSIREIRLPIYLGFNQLALHVRVGGNLDQRVAGDGIGLTGAGITTGFQPFISKVIKRQSNF